MSLSLACSSSLRCSAHIDQTTRPASGESTEPHASTWCPVMVRTCLGDADRPRECAGEITGTHPTTPCEEIHALPPVRPICSTRSLAPGNRLGKGRILAAMSELDHNPHAGRPFTDDDATIAAIVEDLSVPALLCSMVHITGDPQVDPERAAAALVDAERLHGRHDRGGTGGSARVGAAGDPRVPRRRLRAPARAVRRRHARDDGVPRDRTARRRRRADVPRGPPPRRRRRTRDHVGRRDLRRSARRCARRGHRMW